MFEAPPLVHIQFLACPEDDPDLGPWRIRKWSTRPFEGAQAYAPVAAGSLFAVGDPVDKATGYGFPGIVVAIYAGRDGRERIVVESTVAGAAGWQHIFAPTQLIRRQEPKHG